MCRTTYATHLMLRGTSNMRSEQIVAVVEVVRPSIISYYQYKDYTDFLSQ